MYRLIQGTLFSGGLCVPKVGLPHHHMIPFHFCPPSPSNATLISLSRLQLPLPGDAGGTGLRGLLYSISLFVFLPGQGSIVFSSFSVPQNIFLQQSSHPPFLPP